MPESQKSNRSTLTLLLLLLITSLGANFYQWKNHSTTVVQHGSEVDSLMNARIEVERELTSVGMELEKYRGIAGNLDTLLNDANDKISVQEAKIRKLMAGETDMKKLNNESFQNKSTLKRIHYN